MHADTLRLMTGRYSIRSGNHTVAMGGERQGSWPGSARWGHPLQGGYATACLGKWHIGAEDGRWPTDHGFDEWYGVERSYDECLWADDPWYDRRGTILIRPARCQGREPARVKQLTIEARRDIDAEYQRRAFDFVKRSVNAGVPFFLYYNHSMMHLPTVPRDEFKARAAMATLPTACSNWTTTSGAAGLSRRTGPRR